MNKEIIFRAGIFGYSAYSSTKFALRGLAESIAMELRPYNISVTLCLPPDTDTPGFAEEEKSKPLETKLIAQMATLVTPEEVAEQLFKDARVSARETTNSRNFSRLPR